jgi:hypothetical protein
VPQSQSDVSVDSQIYHGTRKLIRPHVDLPVAMVTYGQGTLADQTIAQLAVGLRAQLGAGGLWPVAAANYTVEEIATRVRAYYAEQVVAAEAGGHHVHTPVGFLIAGYSAGAAHGEIWEVRVQPGGFVGPLQLDAEQNSSLQYRGFTEPLDRLINGAAANILALLHGAAPPKLQVARPEMPLVDAVELADWLANVVKGAVNFSQIAPIVGGVIDVAHISLEHGFVWARQQVLPYHPDAVDDLE